MNISFLTASLSREAGGLFQSVRGLARALVGPNHNIFVLGVRDKHTAADIGAWKPVVPEAFAVYGPDRFSYAPGLKDGLKKGNPDILQLHGLWRYPSIVATSWHRRTSRPYIVHPHGMLDPWAVRNSHWKKVFAGMFFENTMLHNAGCIRALCQSEAESIRRYGLRNPICVIPNGIDMLEIRDRRSEMGNPPWAGHIEPGKKVLLYLGRIHPKKGLPNLLRAWKAILNSQPSTNNWLLAIAGWDEMGHENELKRLCHELQVSFTDIRTLNSELRTSNSILFLGPQFNEAKSACYRHCDAFILPSFSEGLPMVILEAWACGKPVVMTPECNLPEGFSARAGIRITTDVEGIAHGLTELFGMSAQELTELGRNGRRLTEEKFNWDRIARQLRAVCEWLVCGAAQPDCVYVD
jgi:poly(glycerol-phosphate) alpha-glucosyltransferase